MGITPNQITLLTCFLCVLYAALMAWSPYTRLLLIILPLLLFMRMALNALDGMVAEETENKTAQGSVLNEVCDVVADAALFSAFLLLLSDFSQWWWGLIILVLLTEFMSLAVFQAYGVRSHSGPFGKSDRAVYLGLFAILLVIFPASIASSSLWVFAYIFVGIVLSLVTIWNRFKSVA